MKLEDLNKFVTACVLAGVEIDKQLTVVVDDYYEQVPEDRHNLQDLEYGVIVGDRNHIIYIVPPMQAIKSIEVDYEAISPYKDWEEADNWIGIEVNDIGRKAKVLLGMKDGKVIESNWLADGKDWLDSNIEIAQSKLYVFDKNNELTHNHQL